MEDIYGRAVALIGKTPDSEEFQRFVQDLGEAPAIGPRKGHMYRFLKFGFSLYCNNTVSSVTFHLPSPHRDREHPAYFNANLVGGLQQDDTAEIMRRKLTVYGCHFVKHEEIYRLPSGATLTLQFDEERQLTEAVVSRF
jgi:hypothetical protein